jgi:transcriptional antiterminator RfaH
MCWRPILSTIGVADIVRAGDEPASVPSRIVAAIRAQEEAGDFDRLNPRHSLRLGQLVRVSAGAFEDMVGTLVELRDQERIVVLLEWLGRLVRAQLRARAVEAA